MLVTFFQEPVKLLKNQRSPITLKKS